MEKSTDIIMSHWQMFESTFYFAGGGGGWLHLQYLIKITASYIKN